MSPTEDFLQNFGSCLGFFQQMSVFPRQGSKKKAAVTCGGRDQVGGVVINKGWCWGGGGNHVFGIFGCMENV